MDEIFEYYIKIFAVTFSIGLCVRAYFSYKTKHFAKKGLQTYLSFPFVGSLGPLVLKMQSFPDFVQIMYRELNQYKVAGIYDATRPAYFVSDPDLLRQIMIKDFDHFVDRLRAIPAEADSIFGKNLMSLKGKEWHSARAILSPAFTASKMKIMFKLMTECGDQLTTHLQETCKDHEGAPSLDMRNIWSRYAADVIATTAYGVECNTLQNPQNEFFQHGTSLTCIGFVRMLSLFGNAVFPKLMKMFGVSALEPKAEKFFSTLVRDTLREREENNIVRPDMIHLLMQARKGALKLDTHEEDNYHSQENSPALEFSDDHITGQAILFFFAGFDTVSTVLTFLSYFLAMNPDIQNRVQKEIGSVLENNDHKLTYETIQKMKYLHMVVSETLRICPPAVQTDRLCVKDYIIPPTNTTPEIHVEKGEGIWIPIYGLHHDPEHFPNPEKFDPERFSEDNVHSIKPFTYMPFGKGPRNCIGMRFALMEVKIAIVCLLSNFNLCKTEKTPEKIVFSTTSLNINLQGGCWIGITPRKDRQIINTSA